MKTLRDSTAGFLFLLISAAICGCSTVELAERSSVAPYLFRSKSDYFYMGYKDGFYYYCLPENPTLFPFKIKLVEPLPGDDSSELGFSEERSDWQKRNARFWYPTSYFLNEWGYKPDRSFYPQPETHPLDMGSEKAIERDARGTQTVEKKTTGLDL
ncbi:MAG: hypothetical protein AAGJ81_14665 [Verrucomicrobiota bacterium]